MSDFLSKFTDLCARNHFTGLQRLTSEADGGMFEACIDTQPSEKRLIKLLKLHPDIAPTVALKEAGHFPKLNHPNILFVHSYFDFTQSRDCFLAIVYDHAECYLTYEIGEKRNASTPYSERRILQMATEVSSALIHMKSFQLAHRNVTPENIFLSQGNAKLTGFLCIREGATDSVDRMSIIGEEVYWSPKLWNAHSASEPAVTHNVYKSDIYALGLTLLSMAMLASTQEMTQTITDGTLQEAVEHVNYSERVKRILRGALHTDEESRLTAEELFQIAHTSSRLSVIDIETVSVQQVQGPSDNPAPPSDICKYCNKPIPDGKKLKYTNCGHGLCTQQCKDMMKARIKVDGVLARCQTCGVEIPNQFFEGEGKQLKKKPVCKRCAIF